MAVQFSQLVAQLGAGAIQHSLEQEPTLDPLLSGVAAIDQAVSGTLSFIENLSFASQIATTGASALILPLEPASLREQAKARQLAWIATPQPRLLFAQAIAQFYQPFRPEPGIHPTAVIDASVQVGQEVYIGPHVVIQRGVTLGDQVCIHPNVVIYPQVTIGDRTVLHANCVIHERTQIGADCVIHSGAVIGSEGFGFVPTAQGWYKMEQSGYTVLEDGVEVGCNSTIDRPAVGVTRIGWGTKLDNLIHIAHGCEVGRACAMAAQVGLAGGVKVGDRVILAGQVGVANQVKLGDGAIASAQSGIHADVPPGAVVSGTPAMPNKLWLKTSALIKRLPEFYQTLKRLQQNCP